MKQIIAALTAVVVVVAVAVAVVAGAAPSATQASAAPRLPARAPTPAELSNCVANVVGVHQPTALKQAACADVIDDLSFIGPLLKMAVIPLISKPRADGFQLNFSATNAAVANASMGTLYNGASPCFITIYPVEWEQMKKLGTGPGTGAYADFAHEVVHCYQLVVFSSVAVFNSAPAFIGEGSVEYLGVEAVGYDSDPGYWYKWFNQSAPQPSLLSPKQNYNAIGWYSVVAEVEGSLWPKMAGAWRDFMTGGASAFIHALGGDSRAVETTWGPSLANSRTWGEPWLTVGTGIPHDAYGDGTIGQTSSTLPAWSGELDRIGSLGSQFQLIRVVGGYGAVHDNAGHHVVGFTDEVFCTDPRGCVPPSEDCANSAPLSVPSLVPPYLLALSSGADGAKFTVQPFKTVSAIPAAISPCSDTSNGSGTVRDAALAHFSADPCALLTDGDWDAATEQVPAYSIVQVKSPQGGACQWEMKTAGPDGDGTNTNFALGNAGIAETSWAQLLSELTMQPEKASVHGLAAGAWCIIKPPKPPTTAANLLVELNPDWLLEIDAASCKAATYLGHQAYDILLKY